MGLSETYSKNYGIVAEYVKNYASAPVKSVADPEITDLSYDPNSTVKSITQQQKHLSNEELELIAQKYLAGVSTYELAKEFGCHRYTISNNLKKMGIDVSGHMEGRKYKTEDVIRLYTKEGKSVSQIAKMFNVCDGTIYKCLKRNGINTSRTRWDYEK